MGEIRIPDDGFWGPVYYSMYGLTGMKPPQVVSNDMYALGPELRDLAGAVEQAMGGVGALSAGVFDNVEGATADAFAGHVRNVGDPTAELTANARYAADMVEKFGLNGEEAEYEILITLAFFASSIFALYFSPWGSLLMPGYIAMGREYVRNIIMIAKQQARTLSGQIRIAWEAVEEGLQEVAESGLPQVITQKNGNRQGGFDKQTLLVSFLAGMAVSLNASGLRGVAGLNRTTREFVRTPFGSGNLDAFAEMPVEGFIGALLGGGFDPLGTYMSGLLMGSWSRSAHNWAHDKKQEMNRPPTGDRSAPPRLDLRSLSGLPGGGTALTSDGGPRSNGTPPPALASGAGTGRGAEAPLSPATTAAVAGEAASGRQEGASWNQDQPITGDPLGPPAQAGRPSPETAPSAAAQAAAPVAEGGPRGVTSANADLPGTASRAAPASDPLALGVPSMRGAPMAELRSEGVSRTGTRHAGTDHLARAGANSAEQHAAQEAGLADQGTPVAGPASAPVRPSTWDQATTAAVTDAPGATGTSTGPSAEASSQAGTPASAPDGSAQHQVVGRGPGPDDAVLAADPLTSTTDALPGFDTRITNPAVEGAVPGDAALNDRGGTVAEQGWQAGTTSSTSPPAAPVQDLATAANSSEAPGSREPSSPATGIPVAEETGRTAAISGAAEVGAPEIGVASTVADDHAEQSPTSASEAEGARPETGSPGHELAGSERAESEQDRFQAVPAAQDAVEHPPAAVPDAGSQEWGTSPFPVAEEKWEAFREAVPAAERGRTAGIHFPQLAAFGDPAADFRSAIEDVVAHRQDADPPVITSRFDVRRVAFGEDQVTELTLRVSLSAGTSIGADQLDGVWSSALQGVQDHVNQEGARFRTGPAGDRLFVRLERVGPGERAAVPVTVSGDQGQSNALVWRPDITPQEAAHEVLHGFGVPDEHNAGAGPRVQLEVPGSLMGDFYAEPHQAELAQSGLRPRYLDLLGATIGEDVPVVTYAETTLPVQAAPPAPAVPSAGAVVEPEGGTAPSRRRGAAPLPSAPSRSSFLGRDNRKTVAFRVEDVTYAIVSNLYGEERAIALVDGSTLVGAASFMQASTRTSPSHVVRTLPGEEMARQSFDDRPDHGLGLAPWRDPVYLFAHAESTSFYVPITHHGRRKNLSLEGHEFYRLVKALPEYQELRSQPHRDVVLACCSAAGFNAAHQFVRRAREDGDRITFHAGMDIVSLRTVTLDDGSKLPQISSANNAGWASYRFTGTNSLSPQLSNVYSRAEVQQIQLNADRAWYEQQQREQQQQWEQQEQWDQQQWDQQQWEQQQWDQQQYWGQR